MSASEVSFDSDAFRANIATTAQKVVIPPRYLPLVQAVEDHYGVRSSLSETLEECFHSFRNADLLIEGFQGILLSNWAYFEESEERTALSELLAELVLDLLRSPLSDDQFSRLLRCLLSWCTGLLAGPHGEDYDDGLRHVGDTLSELLPGRQAAFLERDVQLRSLVERASERPVLADVFLALYRQTLLSGYRRVSEHLDIPAWATADNASLTDAAAVAAFFSFLDRAEVAALAHAAKRAAADELLSAGRPLFSEILDRTIDQLGRVKLLEDSFAVCLYLLKDQALGHRQDAVVTALLNIVRQMLRAESHLDVEMIISRLTSFFRDRDNQFLLMRFKCYEAMGVAIGQARNVKAADHLVADILYWYFQYPEIQGTTDDWETIVNPYHLPKIRCWMGIIESNPALYERLAAALNVQLRLGGVHIADTDLFQRDVTRFLNADIRPIYFVAKQLLRTLPVYFNDVGAEGELRALTTAVDEVCKRHDTLMHFLRKQSHAESSNRLVTFSRAILRYWFSLDPEGLEPYVSANTLEAVRAEPQWAQGPRGVLLAVQPKLTATDDVEEFLDRLLTLEPGDLEERLAELGPPAEDPAAASEGAELAGAPGGNGDGAAEACAASDAQRVSLMVRTHQMLARKYSLSAEAVGDAVEHHLQLPARHRERFQRALAGWQAEPVPATRDRLVDAALDALEKLKEIILSPAPREAVENIYQKRHIAAGIPSLYGTYNEPKFDALGLSFRLENLVGRLFDDIVAEGIEPYVTRESLRRMAATMRRFERALAVDGVDSRALKANLSMLEASFASHNFTFGQYQNMFQFLAASVAELSASSILSHEQVLHAVLTNDPRQCQARNMSVDAVAEIVLRDVLASALGMQSLDHYVAAALRQMSTLNGRLSSRALTRMMNYDPERLLSPIHEAKPSTDDQMTLGFKGLGLKQMALYGHRVPEGFIITTELFDALPALSHRPLYDDTIERIRSAIGRLEKRTHLRLGDPGRALLLSIRSGAAISMPGLMTTVVNVGLNDELAEALSRKPGLDWSTWDSYRRFLQSWAMAAGVDRDFFDAIMIEFKDRYGVEQKLDFTPLQMREIAYSYRERAREVGVDFANDPFEQVVWCILRVLESWDSKGARLYRQYIGVSEEWGTAVVVQRMVFGNLTRRSGSGVALTHNPLEPYSQQVRLFGDFAVRCQGEDVVGGLVFPLPISEAQRLGSATYRGSERSLEKDFPEIYHELLSVARDLVSEREFDPQEIEFTFESPAASSLHVLQKRAVAQERARDAAYFDTSSPAYGEPVAVGMGVAGGAYSGRAAVTAEQIERLLADAPDDAIVLLRPDTVPEDIGIIAHANGILTARGGATSHAAVTARRLGKTAVVDCRDLEVHDRDGSAHLAGHRLQAGDWLSIDGRTGNIFIGRIPTTTQAGPAIPLGLHP